MVLFYYFDKFKQYISSFFFYSVPLSYEEIKFIKSKPLLNKIYEDLKIPEIYKKLGLIYKKYDRNTNIDIIINALHNEILCYNLGFKLNEKNIQYESVLKKIELENLKKDFITLKNLKDDCQKYMKVYEIVF